MVSADLAQTKGLGCFVVFADVALDGGLQVGDGFEGAAGPRRGPTGDPPTEGRSVPAAHAAAGGSGHR